MSNSPPIVQTLPLFFFLAQSPQIELSRNLRIRAVRRIEKYPPVEDERGKRTEGFGWGLQKWEAALLFVVDCLGPSSSDATKEIERLAACLLMHKTNLDLSNHMPSIELSYNGRWGVECSGQLPLLIPEELEKTYLIPPWDLSVRYYLDDENAFLNFWREAAKETWPPNLMGAARRLLRAQHRFGEEKDDKLIDLLIALEALVLAKKELPKGKNLSRRAGRLQGLQGHLEQDAIEELSVAYDLRNDAVRDGFFSDENLSKVGGSLFLWRFITHLEQYVRVGMRNYIKLTNQGLSKDEIIRQLS